MRSLYKPLIDPIRLVIAHDRASLSKDSTNNLNDPILRIRFHLVIAWQTKSSAENIGADVDPTGMMGPIVSGLGDGMTAAADAVPKIEVTDALSFDLTVGLSIVNVAGWFQLRMLDEATDIYDLQGHKVIKEQMKKGVYIVKTNNRTYKMIVK